MILLYDGDNFSRKYTIKKRNVTLPGFYDSIRNVRHGMAGKKKRRSKEPTFPPEMHFKLIC